MNTKTKTQQGEIIVEIPAEEQCAYARSILAALKNQSGTLPLESNHLYYLCDMLEQTLQLKEPGH